MEVTPDIDSDSISFMSKIKKKYLKMKEFPYFWLCVYLRNILYYYSLFKENPL